LLTRLRKRLSYANIVASLALFIALGGVSYAATASRNTVRSSSIRNGEVKTADIGSNAITSVKIKNGQVGSVDIANSAVNSAKIANGSVARGDLAAGAAGLRAYGAISDTGVLTQSRGIASVNHPVTGVYCVGFDTSLGITKDSLVVPSLQTISGDTTSQLEVRWETTPVLCAAGAVTLINSKDAGGTPAEDHALFLLVP
jgi:hypothetical protein